MSNIIIIYNNNNKCEKCGCNNIHTSVEKTLLCNIHNLYDYNPTINKCFKCKNITQYINSNKDKICKLCLKKYNLM